MPLDERAATAMQKSVPQVAQPWEKFSLSIGALVAGLDSSVRFGAAGVGVDVSLEDALGFNSGVVSPRVEGSWRYTDNRRHRVALMWADLSRDSKRTLARDVDLGNGVILQSGDQVSTKFNIQLVRTEYSYSFLLDDRIDMAAAFGLYVLPIDVELQAQTGPTVSRSFDINAPLPMGGLRMDVLLSSEVYLRSHLNFFYIELDHYTGSMFDSLVAIEWVPVKHFGIGFGYNAFEVGASAEGVSAVPGVSARGNIDFGYAGLSLYLRCLM